MEAICYLRADNIKGVILFEQKDCCIIKGIIKGLEPGEHGFHIHEFGDTTNGCISMGGHYNPFNKTHGSPDSKDRHVGDLGNIVSNKNKVSLFMIKDNLVNINDIVGRGLVVHKNRDDLGKGNNKESLITGNAGERIVCGIIGRK